MKNLIMYSTQGCHLCSMALEIIKPFEADVSFTIQVIDIALSDQLVDEYGIRIPVIKYNENELGWPFIAEEFSAWLGSL